MTAGRDYDVSVVTVTYNEAGNIGALLREIRKVSLKHHLCTEIIVVDDSSPDGTGDVVAGIAANDPDVVLVTRPEKAGIGSAYLTGLRQARGHCVVTMDADLSHPPVALPALVEQAASGVVVGGSRFLAGSAFTTSVWRKGATRILNLLAEHWLDLGVRDHTNGYLALQRENLDRILETGARLGVHPFRHTLYGVALFALARHLGLPVGEVEAPYRFRECGESKINGLAGTRLFVETARLIIHCGKALRRAASGGDTVLGLYERRWRTLEDRANGDPVRNALAESIAHARELVGNPTGTRLLDLGAGLGDDALCFARTGAIVWAVDLVPSSTRIVRQRAAAEGLSSQVKVVRMDGAALAFQANSFDVVFLNAVLMHLDHSRLFAEVHRLLRPSGRVVFHEPCGDNPVARIYRRLFSEFQRFQPRYLTHAELAMAGALFRPRRLVGFYLLSALLLPALVRLGPQSPFRRLGARLVRVEARLLSRAPWLRRFGWVLVGELIKSRAGVPADDSIERLPVSARTGCRALPRR